MKNTKISMMRRVTYGNKSYDLQYMSPQEAGIRHAEAKRSFQELPLLERIAKMSLTGTYLDIGANVGNHSTFFNWHTRADKIHAFEPHPQTYKTLVANMGALECDRVQTYNVALWESCTQLHMDELPKLNAGRAQIVELGGKFARKKKYKVPGRTIDSLNLQNVTLIKMDVEDAESRVLKGGLETIQRFLPVIVAEHHTKSHLAACAHFLLPLGYQLSEEAFEPRGETRLWTHPHRS